MVKATLLESWSSWSWLTTKLVKIRNVTTMQINIPIAVPCTSCHLLGTDACHLAWIVAKENLSEIVNLLCPKDPLSVAHLHQVPFLLWHVVYRVHFRAFGPLLVIVREKNVAIGPWQIGRLGHW
jgi:hypothetical protein